MSNQAEASAPVATPAWQAESLRLTGLLPNTEPDTMALWKGVVGEDPDAFSTRRGFEQKAEGPIEDKLLTLAVRPQRIDWSLSPIVQEELPSSFPSLGPFQGGLESIRTVAERWTSLEMCPSFQRIAMGAVLLFPVTDRVAGYRVVQDLLPAVRLEPENSFDFSYQINRPRPVDLWGQTIRVNRLSKWSVAKFQVSRILLGSPRTVSGEPQFACRLELDISTDQDFQGELTRQQMRTLFNQFAEFAIEISKQGDRP